jgi:MinD-like ATPase involved in chromosome partitioning or flagellar assembly
LIVGGPPNSGKSTFSESLVRALQDQGVSAEAVDLDPWSPTLSFIKGEISRNERDRLKRSKISAEDIGDAIARLSRASRDHDFVVGDAPGGISDEIRPIYRLATHAMILCREDKQAEIDRWKMFFNTVNLRIVATIRTRTSGVEEMRAGDLVEGTLVGLDRTPINTPAIRSLASILRGKFGL